MRALRLQRDDDLRAVYVEPSPPLFHSQARPASASATSSSSGRKSGSRNITGGGSSAAATGGRHRPASARFLPEVGGVLGSGGGEGGKGSGEVLDPDAHSHSQQQQQPQEQQQQEQLLRQAVRRAQQAVETEWRARLSREVKLHREEALARQQDCIRMRREADDRWVGLGWVAKGGWVTAPESHINTRHHKPPHHELLGFPVTTTHKLLPLSQLAHFHSLSFPSLSYPAPPTHSPAETC